MKLTYRGISYEYNPVDVNVSTSEAVGKYRGLDVRFRNPKKALVLNSNLDLKYRGVAYQPTQTVSAPAPQVETVPAYAAESAPVPELSISERARALMMQHDRSIKRRQQAMLTRLDAEVGVDVSEASRYWGRVQGKVHPSFRSTYDRSSVAFS